MACIFASEFCAVTKGLCDPFLVAAILLLQELEGVS